MTKVIKNTLIRYEDTVVTIVVTRQSMPGYKESDDRIEYHHLYMKDLLQNIDMEIIISLK